MESISINGHIAKTFGYDGCSYIGGIVTILNRNLTMPESNRIDVENVFNATVFAAASNTTISGVQQSFAGLPSNKTCLSYLHELDLNEMIESNGEILHSIAGEIIKPGKSYSFAIDIVQDPYYGERDGDYAEYITGGKRKASTNYFYSYLTLYVCDDYRRLTLLAIPWKKGMKMIDGVKECIERIRVLDLGVKCLCMDRGFYSVDTFQYLQQNNVPYIVPVKEMGEELKELLSSDASGHFIYTMHNSIKNSVDLTICNCVFYLKGKNGVHGKDSHAFVIFGIDPKPRRVRGQYSRRFGIESSYRLKNIPKAWTTSHDPAIRFFYILLTFIMQNIWIYIQWKRFAKKQRGPKVIYTKRFSFKHFISLILDEGRDFFTIVSIDTIATSG